MRLATFNIENLDLPPKAAHPIEVRAKALAPLLDRLDADILCLQEVNGQRVAGSPHRALTALDQLLVASRYKGFHRAVTLRDGGPGVRDVHNLVTLSRWPIVASRVVQNELVAAPLWHQTTATPATGTPIAVPFDRPVLVTDIDVAGLPVTVINVHLRAPIATPIAGQKLDADTWRTTAGWAEGFFVSAQKRAAQALEVRLVVDSLLDVDPARLVAVAGDFNAEDREMPIKLVIAAEEDTGNAALASRALVLLDRAIPEDRRWSMRLPGRVEMPDHILVTQGLYARWRGIDVFNETLEDVASDEPPAASSHAPLVAEFDLP